MKSVLSLAATLAVAATATAASVSRASSGSLTPVTVKGNAFFTGSNRFYVRGVDYQPNGSSNLVDPLADASVATCTRDIASFKSLGLNAIRVYSVDNSAKHDICMKALEDAGIYLILDVNSPKYSINRQDPAPSYNPTYLQNVFATIDAFAKYDNTMAFFSGNEVINETSASTMTAPYIKAVTRDMKSYIKAQGYRSIPVGYSATDVTSNRYETALYLNCGSDDERSDFFAFNDYSWCNPSSFQQSGWDQKVKLFSNYSLPLFLSEYGCNTGTRTFGEVQALYSSQMTGVYSGGLVYEYTQEVSDFGLVNLVGGIATPLPDFNALMKQLKANPAPTGDGGYRANAGGANACPPKSATWLVSGNALPVLPDGANTYMKNGAGQGVGLKGIGSQTAGGASAAVASSGSGTSGTTSGTAGAATSSKGAAGRVSLSEITLAPFACAAVMLISTLLGTSLVL